MAINLSELWDYGKPDLSEERFRAALPTASADERRILHTQIARTYGIRRNFAQAQEVLADIEPQIQEANIEAKVRYYLELGRTYSSATHPIESQTTEVRELARSAYMQAFHLAQEGKLDGLAIDALHMMTVVDTAPEEQIEWNRQALALMESSSQPEAKKWAGSLHNNMGYALHLHGRYEDALLEFKLALAARERDGNPQTIRIGHWMIAWTLRAMGRLDEAIEIQLRLARECDEAGEPDPYVFEELEKLYRTRHNHQQADFYATRRKFASTQPDGYLALPATGKGKPVLILHAWWGLNDTIKAFCHRLAEAGFMAFAPDLYHGKVAETIAEAEALGGALDASHLQAKAEIVEAVKFLSARTGPPDRSVAVIGFSLGAYYALDLSAAEPERVHSVVIFYGTGPADFSKSKASYLGHFAGDDPYEPQSNVADLEAMLEQAGRPVTFYTYSDTGHWFFEPDRVDAFNQAAADLAWERTFTFLSDP